MILEIHRLGPGLLTCTVASGTLRHRHQVAYVEERVQALAYEVLEVLHRGNQTRQLTEANLDRLRAVGEELARRLLPGPVLSEIRKSMGSLVLELDSELLYLPWELLYDGEQFLCRRFDMGRLVRTQYPIRATVFRPLGAPPAKLLVLTPNPDGDLPEAEREGREIVGGLGSNTNVLARLVAEPTVEFVRRELKDYDLVHFSGHAIHPGPDKRFPEPGWRLMDGLLTVSEVAGMGAGRPMPLLVFSNACQSGVFNVADQGGFSLPEAFLTAGVRFYIGTQWEVVDGQGAQFAGHFYADLARGATIGAAVRNARNRIVAESGESQLAWATYVLYGDPTQILVEQQAQVGAGGLSDVEPDLRLGVRATAPYKPKSRRPGSASELSQVRNGQSVLKWVVPTVFLAALVSLFSAGVSGYLMYRWAGHGMHRPAGLRGPGGGHSGEARKVRKAGRLVQQTLTRDAGTKTPARVGPPGIAVEVSARTGRQGPVQDAAVLFAACLSEKLRSSFTLYTSQEALGSGGALVQVRPSELDGRLFLVVTTSVSRKVLDTKVVPADPKRLPRDLESLCEGVAGAIRRVLRGGATP